MVVRRAARILGLAALLACLPAGAAELPARVERIVLHVLGGPSYEQPDMRFRFRSPDETLRRWRWRRFGTHWIVATDGALWPRHPAPGQPAFLHPPVDRPAGADWRARLAREAAPVYGHVHGFNDESLGIELAHSGRSDDPFGAAQLRSLAWLLDALLAMSDGRLTPASICGHKDLDRRPAYTGCERPGCPVLVDAAGAPYRRRVDPPESLFRQLAELGLVIPRPGADLDADLIRAEALAPGASPSRVGSARARSARGSRGRRR